MGDLEKHPALWEMSMMLNYCWQPGEQHLLLIQIIIVVVVGYERWQETPPRASHPVEF